MSYVIGMTLSFIVGMYSIAKFGSAVIWLGGLSKELINKVWHIDNVYEEQ